MTGLLRKALLVAAVAAVVAAPAAMAGQPDPSKCTVPTKGIMYPGANDPTVPPAPSTIANPYTVIVRDATNAVIPGINVYLDFSLATDERISDVQEAGTTVDCPGKRIYRVTDATGTAAFVIRGAGRNSTPFPGPGPGGFGQVKVVAGSTQIGTTTISAPDENGAGTSGTVVNCIDSGDQSFARSDILNYSISAGRTDFTGDGTADPADGSILRFFVLNPVPAEVCPQATTYCP